MTISERIKSERKRLNFKSKELAELLDCHPVTQSNYETGKRTPDLEYLEKLANFGFDISYIITGKKGSNAPISLEESALLLLYRNATPDIRKAVMALFTSGATSAFATPGININISGNGTNNAAVNGGTINVDSAKPTRRKKA